MSDQRMDNPSFREWLLGMKRESEAGAGGGYLVPETINVARPGLRAAFWRWLGRTYTRADWHQRGMIEINTHEAFQSAAALAEAVTKANEYARHNHHRP